MIASPPPRQFRVLYRSFLSQLVDLELLPAHGDPSRLVVHVAALLAAVGFILAIIIIPPYTHATAAQIARGAWGDQEFLISTTMTVVGLFTVLAWDSIFASRRDCLLLGSLPIRPRTIFRAKIAAVGTGLAASIVAVNWATGFAYPFVIGGVRSLFAYWGAIAAGGLWMFCILLLCQGLTALLLPYRWQTRLSNALQVTAFFSILGVYFLTPGPSEMELSGISEIPTLARALPSFWFLGLFQQWNGSTRPFFTPLSRRAILWLAASTSVAVITYVLSYFRNMRRMVEEPEIVPSDRARPAAHWVRWAAGKWIANPLDRAIFLFLGRTMARSRQHRNLLAAFAGLALALSLAFAKGLLYGNSVMYSLPRSYGFRPPHWYEPNTPMMAAGFIILFLAVIGARTAFAVPAMLRANWIFRVTAVHSPQAYLAAIRKSMFALIVAPIWVALSVFYVFVWGGLEAWGHVLVLIALGIAVVEHALAGFCKLPFACAYQPGESNLRMRLPVYGSVFLFAVDAGTSFERTMFETAARSALLAIVIIGLVFWVRRQSRESGAAVLELQFEPAPPLYIAPLNLSGDGTYSRNWRYLDLLHAPDQPSAASQAATWLRHSVILIASLCVLGFLYERVAAWANPLPPRAGTSVDIGGRTLNYSCEGQGSPAVIFESGRGGPGQFWTPFQRQVAHYTRACWYDRAGYGWSDPAPFPHPASAIAEDLHRLLGKIGVAPPYVLVGFSFGGICVRVYAHKYPAEVSGMVVIDSTHVDEREPITPPGGGYLPYFPALLPAVAQLLRPVGVVRIIMPRNEVTPFEPRTMVESMKEMDYESLVEARAVRTLGDIPLIVLTAGRHRILPPENPADARLERVREAEWMEAQVQLARLSTRGQQWRFPDASHNLPRDRPRDVLEAIRQVSFQARPSE